MKSVLLLHAGDSGQLSWRAPYAAAAIEGSADDIAATPVAREADLVLVVPAQRVLLQEVTFTASERRLLRQTVPYSVEEQLIDDVDTQHFALGTIAGAQVPVAIIDKQWLSDWLQQCRQAGLDIKRVLPEQLLLPYRDGCWTLAPSPSRWVVRIGMYRGFALEPDNAALALQLLLDVAHELPRQLLICGDEPLAMLLPQLPELLRGSVEVLDMNSSAATLLDTPVIDLLQGVFARTLPWRRWWLQWRRPVAMLAAVLVLQMIVAGVKHHQLNRQTVALRQQIETVYRTVEPRGVINDPELQLRRKVQSLQSHTGGRVMPLLQQVGDALKSIDGVSVQNLTYSEHQGELRISLSAGSFKNVEAARAAIAAAGLNAQLIGSNTDGDKTRAQLRVTYNH